jgi:hypothetical protein
MDGARAAGNRYELASAVGGLGVVALRHFITNRPTDSAVPFNGAVTTACVVHSVEVAVTVNVGEQEELMSPHSSPKTVTDASVFPSSGGGESPSLTIYANALRAAHHVKQQGLT